MRINGPMFIDVFSLFAKNKILDSSHNTNKSNNKNNKYIFDEAQLKGKVGR